jgi:hypothetical protein
MNISNFKLDDKWSIPRRIAEFLIWADGQQAMGFVSYPLVTRAVYNLGSKGKIGDDLVDGVRRRITAVNKLLHREYGRGVITDPKVGVRVSHDDEDTANTVLRRRMARLASAKRAVVDTVSIIDPKKIANKALRAYVERDAREIVATLTSPKFEQKLLPPPIADDEV